MAGTIKGKDESVDPVLAQMDLVPQAALGLPVVLVWIRLGSGSPAGSQMPAGVA